MGVSDRLKSGSTQTKKGGGVSARLREQINFNNARGTAEMDESRLVNESRETAPDIITSTSPTEHPIQDSIANFAKDALSNENIRPIVTGLSKAIEYVDNLPVIRNLSGAMKGAVSAEPDDHVTPGNQFDILRSAFKSAGRGFVEPEQAKERYGAQMEQQTEGMGPVSKFAYESLIGAGTDPLSYVPYVTIAKGIGKGVTASLRGAVGTVQNAAARNAIKAVAENPRLSVSSPFAGGAVAGNPVARGYTENVGRTFGNSPTRVLDDVVAPHVTQPSPIGGIASNAEQLNGRVTTEPVIQQPPQILNRSNATNQLENSNISEIPQPPQRGLRGNHQNQLDNGNFSPELQDMIRNADHSYDVARNVDSVAQANKNIENLPKAESDFLLNDKGGADHIATGYRLMQELDAVGEHKRALIVSNKLEADLLKSGQTSQAASILERLSPDGQLLDLIRKAKRNGKEVSVTDSVKFKELASQRKADSGSGLRENQANEILDRIERGENVTSDDMKRLENLLSRAEKAIKPKVKPIKEDLPAELKDPRKRDKIVSFFDGAEQAALARIKARGIRANSLPLDEWRDHAIIVASQLAKGTIKAATHVEDLVRMFGDEIRPVASQVFQQAQKMVNGVTRSAAEGNLEKANQAFRKLSGQADVDKAIIKETADHVRKLIADAKLGKLDKDGIQKLRDYSDEIAEMFEGKPPTKLLTQEEKFLQTVKSLSKKIAQIEINKIPSDQANREVSNLLRQITKLADEGELKPTRVPIDNKALSDIAHDVMEKTRPNPKPTTLQEKIVEKYIKKNPNVSPKDIDTMRELAKNVSKLEGKNKIEADIAMQKILNSYEKSSLWDKTLAIRYMDMLLNTHTQMVNAISGPIMATSGTVFDVFGTMIDIAMNKMLKTPRSTTLYGTDPIRFIFGWFKNAKTFGKAGWEGVNPEGIQSTNEIRGLAFKSLKNPLGIAERTLGAVAKGADGGTYKTVYNSELEKQGFLDAINTGIKKSDKAAIKSHITKFVNDAPDKAKLQAERIGKNTTFQRSDTIGGQTADWLNSGQGKVKKVIRPGVNTMVPFVRTPINIGSTAFTLTPGGIVKGLYQLGKYLKAAKGGKLADFEGASQREALRTLSMGLVGTGGLGYMGYHLSEVGIITASNDSGDKDVNAIREQAGQGKYRFNTSGLMRYLSSLVQGEGYEAAVKAAKYQEGDDQFDYNKLQPIALPVAIGASLGRDKDRPISERLESAGEDALASLFSMSALKGLQDAFQPQYSGTQGEKTTGIVSRIGAAFFKSFSSGLLAQEARREDPIQRKTSYNNGIYNDVKDYYKSRTPFFGLSESMQPLKTTLGQNKLNAPGIKGQFLNPYRSEVAPYNEAAKIISDLIDRTGDFTLAPSAPDKKVTGKDRNGVYQNLAIPAERYTKMQEEVGNEIIKKVLTLSPTLSDAKKAERLKTIYSDAKSKYRDKVKKELGVR